MSETAHNQRLADSPSGGASRRSLTILAVIVLVLVLVILTSFPRIERFYLRQTGAEGGATLGLAAQVLRGALERTEALPALIAERPILAQLLAEPENEGLVPFTNELLRQMALSLDVSDIYVMDVTGRTVASSNYRTERSFMGQNFAFRPYFIDALDVGLGRYHALGTTSLQRGYFFAAPVIADTQVLGVVAVKLALDEFEESWSRGSGHLIVTDVNNVVFLSDRADWRFRLTAPLPEGAEARIAQTQQYPLDRLRLLGLQSEPLAGAQGLERVRIDESEFVMQTALLAAPSWRVSILLPAQPAANRAWSTVLILSLAVVSAGLLGAVFLGRRARLIERLEAESRLASLLEARVAERTQALNIEIDERRATEERLRRTQAELVQAGKLAALGSMSAALSHEFNQPLAAVKSYAENAATFLDRGQDVEARGNIARISSMADRMAAISKHLRNFARRPQDRTGPVSLAAVVGDALELMEPRLRGVALHYTPPQDPIWARGGRVRLQQVVVNLLGNALDAMATNPAPRIEITITSGEAPTICVRDFGPGLDVGALEQAFDPFFTTKDPGKGLGLGLSISYNIVRDFGGQLRAENHSDGGALFSVVLEPAPAPEQHPPSDEATE